MEQKVYIDEDLGAFYWDGLYEWHCELQTSNLGKIKIDVIPQVRDLKEILNSSRNIINSIIKDDFIIKEFAAKMLLDTYNECWSEGNLITLNEFINQVSIFSFSIFDRGTIIVHLNDNELFAGHHISVEISSEGDLVEADI